MAKLTAPYVTLGFGIKRKFWDALADAGLKTSYAHKEGVFPDTTYYNVVIEGTDAQVRSAKAWLEEVIESS